ncbi:Sensor histidine kinase RcsC [bioreactor metagenome]|uniref:histidine kinase n=1 Tax=bioreactor metagenome TaxID=1076179 RepID=A0A644X3A5_9ZZZZ
MLKKDGSKIIIEMSSRLMPDGTYQCFAKDITGNIKAQEALNESESRLRKFFECTQEGIVFHDKGLIEDVNKAHMEMLGISDEQEMIGRKIYDFISPETIDIVKHHVENHLTEKYEAECIRIDGSVFPVEISPRVIEISDGRKVRIASVTDITERKNAERIQKVNTDRTRALLTLSQMYNAPLSEIADFILEEAIKLTGSKIGYIAFLNEAENVLSMHAWSREALEECRVSNVPREYPLEKTGLWGEAVRQRKPVITNDYAADNPLKKGIPEGHVKIFRHLNVPVLDGNKIVAVIGVGNKEEEYYDECINQLTILGKAMWTHIDRQRAIKELIESREQFRLITENSNDMIVTFDAENGVISYLSPGSGQIQKFESEEVVQKSFFDFCHPDDIPSLLEAQKEILSGKELPLLKHRIMMKDGSFQWFETSTKLVTDPNSGKVEIVAVCRDISEILKTEQMRKEKEAAEAASKAKSEFLANVSHEIRNPLNSIVGLANTLTRANLSSDIQEIVNAIKISSGNLLNIINDVLDLSKIEANRVELANEEFEARNVFREVCSLFRSGAENKGLKFSCEVYDSVPQLLKGDMVRFKQMVVNLAGNAVKFTDNGSVTIHARAEKADDRTIIITEVKDSGIGIKKEDFDKLFRSFSQLDSSTTKKYAGTGLGLAIVKSFADMMGGDISVESEYGVGSTFTLKIPFMTVEKAAGRSESDIDEQKNIEQCRVLLVEDDAINQMYLKGFLKSNGMIVDSAFNGLQALEKYESGEYDVILMDGQMPKMDGFEATRIIREKEKDSGKHTPVIAITGYAIKGDEERFINAGMDSYITKPFDENKLLEVIRKLTKG